MRAFPDAAGALIRTRIVQQIVRAAILCTAPGMAHAQVPRNVRAPLTAFDSAKTQVLLRTRLPCLGCHVVGSSGGHVGPDLTHVASRRSMAYIRRMVTDPAQTIPGTTMPRIAMAASTRELLIGYLSVNAALNDSPPLRSPQPMKTEIATTPTGAALYARHCVACHGERGKGDGPNARFLPVRPAAHADPVQMSSRSNDRLFDAIHGGGYPLGRSVMMPAFGETLTRAEIWLLVGHVRMLCGCAGPVWSRRESARATTPPTRPAQ